MVHNGHIDSSLNSLVLAAMYSSPESGTRELEELRTGEACGGYPDKFLNPLPSIPMI